MLKAATKRKTLRVVADQIGTPTASADLASAIVAILKAPQWIPGIFHYTNEGVASWYDFAKAIFRIAGITDIDVRPISTDDYNTEFTTSAARPPYSVLDKQLIKRPTTSPSPTGGKPEGHHSPHRSFRSLKIFLLPFPPQIK